MKEKNYNTFSKVLLFFASLLLILNPYTSMGNLGFYATLPFVILALRSPIFPIFIRKRGFLLLLLITISFYAVFISAVNDIFQIAHLYVTISMIITIIISIGLWSYCRKKAINFDQLLFVFLGCIVFNSIVIVLQLILPQFRVLIESFLVQSASDYTISNRFRGIASSGGAALSILSPIGIALTFQLYINKRIGSWFVATCIVFLFMSCLLIGRTGLALSSIPITFFIFWSIRTNYSKLIILAIPVLIITYLTFSLSINYLEEVFGESFIFYTGGFLFQEQGLESEGTLGRMAHYLEATPTEWPYILTGYGYFGHSDFTPRSDSGLARMFMAIGYLLGLVYYVLFFKIVSLFSNKDNLFILISGFTVLILAEIKESILLSQFASRAMIIIAIFSYLDSILYYSSRSNTSKILK